MCLCDLSFTDSWFNFKLVNQRSVSQFQISESWVTHKSLICVTWVYTSQLKNTFLWFRLVFRHDSNFHPCISPIPMTSLPYLCLVLSSPIFSALSTLPPCQLTCLYRSKGIFQHMYRGPGLPASALVALTSMHCMTAIRQHWQNAVVQAIGLGCYCSTFEKSHALFLLFRNIIWNCPGWSSTE